MAVSGIITEHWGKIPYALAHQQQQNYVREIAAGERKETVVLCSHPPVVTLGKQSDSEDVMDWSGEVQTTERGGRATYHGPGQVVCYPLLQLRDRGQKLGEYLNALEQALVQVLARYGIQAQGNGCRGDGRLTGVWVVSSGKKLASIGIAVRRWVTYHGLACNLYPDPLAFAGINPCGYHAQVMTTLEDTLGVPVVREEFEIRLLECLLSLLPPRQSFTTQPVIIKEI